MFHDAQIVFLEAGQDEEQAASVKRNLAALYSTPEGTCPGDRSYGLDWSFLDYPLPTAQNMYAIEVIEKTQLYEPRAEVLNVDFTGSADGRLMPVVSIRLQEDAGDEEDDDTRED